MRRPLVVIAAAVLSGMLYGLPGIPIVYRLVPIVYLCGTGILLFNKCRGRNRMPLYFFAFVCLGFLLFSYLRTDKINKEYQRNAPFYEKYEASNPGEFNYALYLKTLKVTTEEERLALKTRNREEENTIQRVSGDLKEECSSIIQNYFSEDDAGIICAMILGNKQDMNEDLKGLYQEAGIAHLLAVSGLHVSMIGTAITVLFKKGMGLGRKTVAILSTVCVFSYALFSGASASSIRAAIMFAVGVLAVFTGRKKDLSVSLALAAIILLIVSPYLIMQSGFQLSFIAICGIIYSTWLTKDWKKWKTFSACICVTMVTMPVVAFSYFQVPLYSFLLNLAVIPLMTVVFVSGAAVLFLGGAYQLIDCLIGIPLFQNMVLLRLIPVVAGAPAHLILKLYGFLGKMSLQLPFSQVLTGRPTHTQITLYYAFLIAIGIFIKAAKNKNYLPALLFCSYLISFPILKYRETQNCYVTVLDVGQGDCFHIHDGKTNIIIDCGSSGTERAGSRILENYLLARRIDSIDLIIVSHADADHTNGILYLYSDDSKVKPENMCLPALAAIDEKYLSLKEAAGKQISFCHKGDNFSGNSFTLKCVYSEEETGVIKDTNRESAVWLLKMKDFSMLFTGDISESEERKIIKEGSLKDVELDVLKCAHHGSATANTKDFLEEAHATWAILSYGKNNRYGHPSAEVKERLNELEYGVLSTEKTGAITFMIYDNNYRVSTFLSTEQN